MQSNEEKEKKDGENGWKEKGNGAVADGADDVKDKEGEGEVIAILVPTKTYDGGSGKQAEETSTDTFRTYSDDDTRMLTLLGLQPPPNPNEGEREDWRQLIGFLGIGEARRRRDDDDGATPRRTRISFELHNAAFENMWIQRGELNVDDVQRDEEREQEEEGKADNEEWNN